MFPARSPCYSFTVTQSFFADECERESPGVPRRLCRGERAASPGPGGAGPHATHQPIPHGPLRAALDSAARADVDRPGTLPRMALACGSFPPAPPPEIVSRVGVLTLQGGDAGRLLAPPSPGGYWLCGP